jgi:hypothetical protein
MPTVNQISHVNLGRIVPPPASGSDVSPTYFPPRLFILNAGAAGIAANVADKSSQVALQRNQTANTGSPNPTSITGSAGTAGLDGQMVAMKLKTFLPKTAITGPGGAPVAPTVGRKPKWLRPTLYVTAGLALGWLVFRG